MYLTHYSIVYGYAQFPPDITVLAPTFSIARLIHQQCLDSPAECIALQMNPSVLPSIIIAVYIYMCGQWPPPMLIHNLSILPGESRGKGQGKVGSPWYCLLSVYGSSILELYHALYQPHPVSPASSQQLQLACLCSTVSCRTCRNPWERRGVRKREGEGWERYGWDWERERE